MRLTCPNCAARYDVPDGMIAAGGRHVQCTACHTRWFERPPAPAAAALGEDEILARLEARGGRGARAGAAGRPVAEGQQSGSAFRWEGRTSEEDAPRPATHLRLVTDAPREAEGAEAPADAGDAARVAGTPVPEPGPSEPAIMQHAGAEPAIVRHAGAEPAIVRHAGAEPAIVRHAGAAPVEAATPDAMDAAPVGRRRLELDRPAEARGGPEPAPAPRPRWGWAVLAIALAVGLLAAAYLAAATGVG